MKVDDNWKKSRILAQDLDRLLNLPVETSEKYFQIIEDLLLHTFLESVLTQDNNASEDQVHEIELPYLGTLIVTIHKGHISTNFMMRPILFKKLQAVYNQKESPLIQTCTDILSNKLVKQFVDGEEDDGDG